MLRINPGLLADPAAAAALGAQPEAAGGPANAAPAAARHQVELLADGNIKLLLDALGKTLGEFSRLSGQLPTTAAQEANNLGRAMLGADTVLPQGLTALVRGVRSGGEALAAFSQTLADAALVNAVFPDGLPPETATAVARFAATAGGDFTARLLTLARQLADAPEGNSELLALAKSLLAKLPAESSAPAVQQGIAKAAGGDFTARLLTLARQLADVPEGNSEQLALVKSLLAELPAEPPAPAVQAGIAKAAGGDFTARLLTLAQQLAAAPEGNSEQLALVKSLLAELPAEPPAPAVQESIAKAAAALERSIPEPVRQAAVSHNLPALQDALVWQKVADSLPWLKTPAETLHQASRTLREMAAAVPVSEPAAADTPAGQKVMVMTLPLFFADGHVYPAYIHISRDREQPDNPAAAVRETWLRVCVATENLGTVNMVFHLRGQEQLSIRVSFTHREAEADFRRALPDLRGALADSSLTLTDLAVVAAAEKL